jgi:DNA invertase Pin-like site-specific DNA recombinase
MTTSTQVSAREYLRVSLDRSGAGRSVEEQRADNARAAASHGWSLGEAYRDNSVSASRYSKKARDGFTAMMTDLEQGRFDAGVLMLWESSRGSRRAGEWVDLVDVCAERGVMIFVTKDDATYDPGRGRDRRSLLSDAIDSEYESSKVSDRTKRSNAANAAAGKPHGRVPYGYRRTYDLRSGALVGQEDHPDEAPVVRELFARIVAGHSLRSIARDFDTRGIRTRSGKPFSAAGLRSLAVRDAYAGRRVHDPGRTSGTTRTADAVTVQAMWPALIAEADFLAVQRILSDSSRRTNRPGRGVHLLSMIARCDVCGGPLSATNRDGRGEQYQCHNRGHVRLSKPDLDAVAEHRILTYLSQDDVHEDTAAQGDSEGLDAARAEVAKIRTELDELADALGRGEVSPMLAARSEPAMRARLRVAENRARELATPSRLRGLIEPGPYDRVQDQWDDDMPMATKREIARIVLAPDVAGVLRVIQSPTPGKNRTPATGRVVWGRATTE